MLAVRLHVPAGARAGGASARASGRGVGRGFAGLQYHGRTAEVFGIDSGFQRFELTGYTMGLLDLWA